jgi:hypothetical protein
MVFRSEQRAYDGEPLGSYSNPPLATALDELAKSLN